MVSCLDKIQGLSENLKNLDWEEEELLGKKWCAQESGILMSEHWVD